MSIQIKQDMQVRTVTSAVVGMKGIPTPIVEAKTLVDDQVYTIFSQADPRDPATQSAYWNNKIHFPIYALCDPDTGLFDVYNVQIVVGSSYALSYGKLMRTTFGKSTTSDKYNYLYEETLDANFIPYGTNNWCSPIYSFMPTYLLKDHGNIRYNLNEPVFMFACAPNTAYDSKVSYVCNKIYNLLKRETLSSYYLQYPDQSFTFYNQNYYYYTENGNTYDNFYRYNKSGTTYHATVTNNISASKVASNADGVFDQFGNGFISSTYYRIIAKDPNNNTILNDASSIVPIISTGQEDGLRVGSRNSKIESGLLAIGNNNNQRVLAYRQYQNKVPVKAGIIRYNQDSTGRVTSCDKYIEFDFVCLYILGWYAGSDPSKEGETYLLGVSSRAEYSTVYFVTIDKNLTEKSRTLLDGCYFRADGWEAGNVQNSTHISDVYTVPQPVGYIKDGKKVGIAFQISRGAFGTTPYTGETYMVCIDV